jgi:hypothetical protein
MSNLLSTRFEFKHHINPTASQSSGLYFYQSWFYGAPKLIIFKRNSTFPKVDQSSEIERLQISQNPRLVQKQVQAKESMIWFIQTQKFDVDKFPEHRYASVTYKRQRNIQFELSSWMTIHELINLCHTLS